MSSQEFRRARTEPLWWMLFAAGGTVAALLTPVLILLIALAAPLGWAGAALSYERALLLASHPLSRLVLFVVISLSFFHWAHRFRYTLSEGLALKGARRLVAAICYGSAAAGAISAAVVVLKL